MDSPIASDKCVQIVLSSCKKSAIKRTYYIKPIWQNKKEKEKNRLFYLPMRNIFVPQTGQTPWVAGLPFFMVTFFSSFIALLALHLTQ